MDETTIYIFGDGYVRFIESWGSDERVIESARMSTDKGFEGWPQDEKLLKYLYTNQHHTPFEMAGMTIEVRAPLFVFREWHRHRTQSYNELSARYTPMPMDDYMPTLQRLMMTGGANTQSKGTTPLAPREELSSWLSRLNALYINAQAVYQEGLDLGVPKEVARCAVTVARYSRMRASANLRNWLGFMRLRDAPNAQYEIRKYAEALGRLLERSFPRTFTLYAKEKADASLKKSIEAERARFAKSK